LPGGVPPVRVRIDDDSAAAGGGSKTGVKSINRSQLQELLARKKLASDVAGRLTPTALLVRPGRVESVQEELARMGHTPKLVGIAEPEATAQGSESCCPAPFRPLSAVLLPLGPCAHHEGHQRDQGREEQGVPRLWEEAGSKGRRVKLGLSSASAKRFCEGYLYFCFFDIELLHKIRRVNYDSILIKKLRIIFALRVLY
jgi:hypothetical protein